MMQPFTRTDQFDFASGSVKQKNRAASGLAADGDPPAVIFDNFFADGKAEAGAVRFSECDKGLKNPVGDFGCDAGTGVLDLGDDFVFAGVEAQENFPAIEHHVGGVVNKIVKNSA